MFDTQRSSGYVRHASETDRFWNDVNPINVGSEEGHNYKSRHVTRSRPIHLHCLACDVDLPGLESGVDDRSRDRTVVVPGPVGWVIP